MTEQKKPKRTRRQFTPEYKAEIVSLCRGGGRSIGQVATDMDLTENSVRAWVKQAETDAGRGRAGALTTAEREELARLRRELKQVTMERDILKNDLSRRSAYLLRRNLLRSSMRSPRGEAVCLLVADPVKKHGPGTAADLRLATPTG